MSLKALHIVFVVASVLMCLLCGVWALHRYLEFNDGPVYLGGGLGAILTAVGLVAYGRYVLRKLRNISYL